MPHRAAQNGREPPGRASMPARAFAGKIGHVFQFPRFWYFPEKTGDMIYWNTTPGAEFDIAVPNPHGILPEDVAGMALRFEVLGDVSLKQFPSGDFTIDAVTPGWFITHLINTETVAPGDFPPDGEYTYRAYLVPQGGGERVLVSVGLMIFGDYLPEREQYEKPIQYEQYD